MSGQSRILHATNRSLLALVDSSGGKRYTAHGAPQPILVLSLGSFSGWKALCGPRRTTTYPCAVPVLLLQMDGVVRPTRHCSQRGLIKFPSVMKLMRSLGFTDSSTRRRQRAPSIQVGSKYLLLPIFSLGNHWAPIDQRRHLRGCRLVADIWHAGTSTSVPVSCVCFSDATSPLARQL